MSLQYICEKCGGTFPASLMLFKAAGFVPGFVHQKSVKNGKPLVVFVDNSEIANEDGVTAQMLTDARVGEVISWNERVYDDEEEFVEDYCGASWREEPDDEKLEAKARELWKRHARECIVCYSHATLPKGCEVAE